MFRTTTGQTGRDAYINEAAAIANAQRELDARFSRLLDAAHEEAPELFENISDFCSQCGDGKGANATHFLHYLQGEEHYAKWLRSPERARGF